MKSKKTRSCMVVFIFLFGLSMSGCIQALMALSAGTSVLWIGGSLYSSVEDADIDTNIPPENSEAVKSIKTVGVLSSNRVSGQQVSGFAMTGTPHLTEGMINSINTTLEGEGIKTIGIFEIEQNLRKNAVETKTDQNGTEYYSKNDLIKSAFALGADAVLVGSGVFGTETKSTGFLGGGAQFTTSVKSMNARLINEEGKSLMTLNLTYKKGQQDQEAGKALGLIVAIKVADPSADVKAEVKKRGVEG